MRLVRTLLLSFLALLLISTYAGAQENASASAAASLNRDLPPGLQIPDAAKAGPNFDVDAATEAYLNLLSPEQRAKSDAYFEGGYWLGFFGGLYGLAVAAILLLSGLSRRMRDIGRKFFKKPFLVSMVYVALWVLVGFLLNLPWASYAEFAREHSYGLATQSYGEWFGDQLKGLVVVLIILPLVISLIYKLVRSGGEFWWVRAAGFTFVLTLFFGMIAPVFIAPLFNTYTPLPPGATKDAIFSLARANQIPTTKVVYFDASKQTTRISANVSGFLNTTQVSLNDNLLNKTSLPEIKAVMGHEMGHYVLNHSLRLTIYLTLIFGLGFYVVHRSSNMILRRFGARLSIEDRSDPAGLPLAVAIFSMFSAFASPVLNSVIRQAEAEADNYGLNSAREPHGFAMAAMRLSTYRKIKPGYWEEVFFYDHPSGYTRVHSSMLWLKENQDNVTANGVLEAKAVGND